MEKQITKLLSMLGLGSISSVPFAAANGLFKIENAPMLAIAFMAGPGAIIASTLLTGSMKERALAALVCGIIATSLVVFSAIIGPSLLSLINMNIVKIFAGLSIGVIAFMIIGIKLPDKLPLVIIAMGVIGGIIWR